MKCYNNCGNEAEWLIQGDGFGSYSKVYGETFFPSARCENCRKKFWPTYKTTPFSPMRKLRDLLEMDNEVR